MSNELLAKNFIASGAITKRRIVKPGAAAGTVAQAAANTDSLAGVSAELDVLDTQRLDVVVAGIADVEFGGVVAAGDLLTADANGKAVAAARHTHTENTAAAYVQNAQTAAALADRIIGIAMVAGVAGDIGQMLIAPGNN